MTVTTTAPSISTIVDRLFDQSTDAYVYAVNHGSIKTGAFQNLLFFAGCLKERGWWVDDSIAFRRSLAMAITDCPDSSLAERLLAIHSSLLDWERAWADVNN